MNEVDQGEDDEEYEHEVEQDDEDDASEDEAGSQSDDDAGVEGSDWPAELINAVREAKAFMTQAKKQRSEVEKARGFFKKTSGGEDKADRIKKLKARLPCAACGQLGHWKDDPECPHNKGKNISPKKKKKKKRKTGVRRSSVNMPVLGGQGDWQLPLTVAGETVRGYALVDTACAKTVAGHSWTQDFLSALNEKGLPWLKVPESEPFRFGPGPRILSKEAVLFPVA